MRGNPAQRLHDVLRSLQDLSQGQSIKASLGLLFEVEVQDVAKTLAVASALAALPDELAGALHDSQDDDEHDDNLLLEWYEPVKRATNELGQLANPLQHFTQHYDAAVLVSLRHISRDFRRRGRDVSDADLDALRDARQNLATALAEEGIPEDLRRFMLVRLAEMADALRLFKLQGAAALRKAVDASVGATVTRQYEGKAVPDPETKVGRSYFDMINKAGTLASLGNNAVQIGTKIIQALG